MQLVPTRSVVVVTVHTFVAIFKLAVTVEVYFEDEKRVFCTGPGFQHAAVTRDRNKTSFVPLPQSLVDGVETFVLFIG